MVEFVFPSKRAGWVYGVHGTVASVNKWSETEVRSSGGGGYISPDRGGYISGSKVSSRAIQHGEIWVRARTGKEVRIAYPLPMSQGHEVVILWGNLKGRADGRYFYWRNFTSGEEAYTVGAEKDLLITGAEQLRQALCLFGLCICASVIIYHLFVHSLKSLVDATDIGIIAFALLLLGVLLFAAPPKIRRYREFRSQISALAVRDDIALDG